VDRRDGPNGSLVEIAWQDWEGKVVDRCHRIPEVAGWWVVCHNCPRVTDWVRVGHRSDQAATLFPIATSWRSFVGCPRGTWVQSLYGDKRTSVVEPQRFSSRPFRSVLISICPQRGTSRHSGPPEFWSAPWRADMSAKLDDRLLTSTNGRVSRADRYLLLRDKWTSRRRCRRPIPAVALMTKFADNTPPRVIDFAVDCSLISKEKNGGSSS